MELMGMGMGEGVLPRSHEYETVIQEGDFLVA